MKFYPAYDYVLWQVHLYIWVSLLCVTVITFTVEFVNPYYATNTKAMLHIGDMFWYMFGALLTQGWLK